MQLFYDEIDRKRREFKRHVRAQLALEYMQVAELSSSPTKDLARTHGRTPAVMSQWVKALRLEGYLTSTVQGRAGGRITRQTADILGIEYAAEAQGPPFSVDVRLEAHSKKDLIYQMRRLIRNMEAM